MQPEQYQQYVDRITSAAKSIVDQERQRAAPAPARRDQHAKHHGCLWAYFDVLPNLPAEYQVGVFAQPGRSYPAWVRPSNSSPRPQPDDRRDGRGLAIKLLDVDGARALVGPASEQQRTQDFVLLNHTCFFAEDLAEMAAIFDWMKDGRALPLYFLLNFRLRGLWAILKLATKPNSPLELTYHSQAAFSFAGQRVKYRLRPITGVEPTEPTHAEQASGDHLRHVLRRQLAPNPHDRQRILSGEDPQRGGEALFAFELQLPGERDAERPDGEYAFREWSGPFVQVAVLRIPRQDFDAPERMSFAERMSFSVWNALEVHKPLGPLNQARAQVYAAIRDYRNEINHDARPAYSLEEWRKLRALPAAALNLAPKRMAEILDALTPRFWGLPLKLLSSRAAVALPGLVLVALLGIVFAFPNYIGRAIAVDAPLQALGLTMPSEDLIPKALPSLQYKQKLEQKPRGYDPQEAQDDPAWLFRYGSMGAEFSAGIPYWIYRVLPRVVPEAFGERKDWSEFGLTKDDDTDYYESYHDLPRGLVLSDTVVVIGNQDFGVKLKRVALNCASCHRGELRDQAGAHFIDGMPNLAFDPAAFKRKLTAAFTSDKFTEKRVIEEIDRALADDHQNAGKPGPAHHLNRYERVVYGLIVKYLRKVAEAKETKLAWMDRRPDNGPGRLDAFGAFRYEHLGFSDPRQDNAGGHIATVDLPAIWNQGQGYRPRHHYDGNTTDARARNVGAIVGVGGHPLSVRLANIQNIGKWIDKDLKSPPYPFARDAQAAVRGKALYEKRCNGCHGDYDAHGELKQPVACMKSAKHDLSGTDAERWQAVDEPFVDQLNKFGERNGLWTRSSFEPGHAYLCPPLDGIWARAPYLHNGSVPTLEHLLSGKRPKTFTRGNPEYDTKLGGFVWDKEPRDGRASFTFDTTLPGNHAEGHDKIVESESDRQDLIQYLYTL